MYMWMEELIYLKDGSLKMQCLNNLSHIQKINKIEDQNKLRLSHLQELKKGRRLRKCNWYRDNQVYLYCVLFRRVVRTEGPTNQMLCKVRIVMLSEIT
jgi:hypothetical protein